MNRHSASQYLELIGPNASIEIEVAITFSFVPGRRETGPTYACGGAPAEPASVEDIDFHVYAIDFKRAKRGDKLDLPAWLDAFIRDAIDEAELLETAREDA